MVNFDDCIDLWDKYYNAHQAQLEFNRDLANEARKRLCQLKTVVSKISTLEKTHEGLKQEIMKGKQSTSIEVSKRFVDTGDEIELLTELFYYLAFRFRCIVRDLPELTGFECKGIRDVRNHLIEHPEGGDSKIFIVSFGFGGPEGPVIKAVRYKNQKDIFVDSGLYKNADEFLRNLKSYLMAKR